MLDRRQTLGHDLLNGLVCYYPLDDSRNSNANTSWREQHAGLVMGPGANNPQDALGVYGGQASQFNAASARFLTRASSSEFQTSDADYSWIQWVYLDSKATTQGFFCKSDSTTVATREWEFQYVTGTDRFRFIAYNNTTAIAVAASTFGSPSTATWYLVYGEHDSTANTIGISVNAGALDTAAFTGGLSTGTVAVRIGSYAQGANYMDGRIERCSMWKRLLTADERTYLYNGGIGRRYPFI